MCLAKILLIFCCFALSVFCQRPCALRASTQYKHFVCVCNVTYCDDIVPVGTLRGGEAALYVSNREGKRLERQQLLAEGSPNSLVLTIDPTEAYQTIIGFGGTFTVASGQNIEGFDKGNGLRENLIQDYFGSNGIGYSLGRVPMGSSDMSDYVYNFDDVDQDFELSHFNLTWEDLRWKLPFVKMALSAATNKLKLFATPWSAPGWMKNNGKMKGSGILKGEPGGRFWQCWADYFVKFFEFYFNEGVSFWGLTIQNEPTKGLNSKYKGLNTHWTAETQRDFIHRTLGPTLQTYPLTSSLKLMIGDDNREILPKWPNVILNDTVVTKYVHGIAIHWFRDSSIPLSVLAKTHHSWPQHFILNTQGGFVSEYHDVVLGDWSRGEKYAHDIIQDLNNWVAGWTDYSLVLDQIGGTAGEDNEAMDAPIISNAFKQEYYKQPVFYVMGHFSKFIVPDSERVSFSFPSKPSNVEATAFVTPEGMRGAVILNTDPEATFNISVTDVHEPGKFYNIDLGPYSIVTLVYA